MQAPVSVGAAAVPETWEDRLHAACSPGSTGLSQAAGQPCQSVGALGALLEMHNIHSA